MPYFTFQYDALVPGEVRLPDYETRDYDWLMDATVDFMAASGLAADNNDLDATGTEVEMTVQGLVAPVVWLMRHVIAPQFYNADGTHKPGT